MTGETKHEHSQCVPECTQDMSGHLADAVWVEPDGEQAFDEMVKLGQEVDPVVEKEGT
jgi:hypothetical protein